MEFNNKAKLGFFACSKLKEQFDDKLKRPFKYKYKFVIFYQSIMGIVIYNVE